MVSEENYGFILLIKWKKEAGCSSKVVKIVV